MAYLLDANVFIAAKNLHYGLDFCPAFWDWLVGNHDAGTVFSAHGDGLQPVATFLVSSQPYPKRERHRFALRVHLQLLEHVLDVIACREAGDSQLRGQHRGGLAAGEAGEDF